MRVLYVVQSRLDEEDRLADCLGMFLKVIEDANLGFSYIDILDTGGQATGHLKDKAGLDRTLRAQLYHATVLGYANAVRHIMDWLLYWVCPPTTNYASVKKVGLMMRLIYFFAHTTPWSKLHLETLMSLLAWYDTLEGWGRRLGIFGVTGSSAWPTAGTGTPTTRPLPTYFLTRGPTPTRARSRTRRASPGASSPPAWSPWRGG